MINNSKVSIIVPIYNSEKYIDRCILSIINQTYKNIEVLLIDDGSIDNSSNRCEYFHEIDSRIKVIHQKNMGISSARNVGIENSSGQYLCFVDSDDYISNTMIENLLTCLNEKNTIACTLVKSFDDSGLSTPIYQNNYLSQNYIEYYRSLLLGIGDCSVWSKMFPREIIGITRFDESKLNEDVLFLFALHGKFDRVVYTGKTDYYYYQRNESISNQYGKSIHDMLINANTINRTVSEKMPSLIKVSERYVLSRNMALVCRCPRNYKRREDKIYIEAVRYVRRNLLSGLINPFFTNKERFKLIITAVCPIIMSIFIERKRQKNLEQDF